MDEDAPHHPTMRSRAVGFLELGLDKQVRWAMGYSRHYQSRTRAWPFEALSAKNVAMQVSENDRCNESALLAIATVDSGNLG